MMLSKKMRALAAALALTMAAGVLGGCGGDKKEETAAKKTANVGMRPWTLPTKALWTV